MKTILSLSALLITLTLTAQTPTEFWSIYTDDKYGIRSFDNQASGWYSFAPGYGTTAFGDWSTAIGYGTQAFGEFSTSLGRETVATGGSSTAMGAYTEASGNYSTAMGIGTIASDNSSLVVGKNNSLGSTVTNSATQFSLDNTAFVIGNGADANNRSDALTVLFDGTTNIAGSVTATAFIGDGSQLTNLPSSSPFSLNDESGTGGIETFGSIASGNSSRALGCCQTIASGDFSTALGGATLASGSGSTTMGYYTEASGDYSTAMGYITTASGQYATAIGFRATASDYGSTVIGQYNSSGSSATSADLFSTSAPAFVIGNGTASDATSDAFKVMFNGDTTVSNDLNVKGNVTVGDVSVLSDARLKANIISLGSTLAKLLQIDGKTYTMKKDENKKQKIGVLAQDIEKVFPELVSESNGVKSVNYQGLVPVLINALKEQDNKMNEQEAKLNKQQAEIDELKAIVTKLITP
jgi:hypothetical protein